MLSKIKVFPLLLISVFVTGCMGAGSNSANLETQVAQQGQVIKQMQTQMFGAQPAQADTWAQLQALQQEVAHLRGQLDNLDNALEDLGGTEKLGEIVTRHDRALHIVEAQLDMELQLESPASNIASTGPLTAPPFTPTTPMLPQDLDTAQALYDSGLDSFNSRNYERGLNAFVDFTQAYPSHKLVSNAWFWQGECLYQMGKYAEAALAYEKVISDFKNSNKSPASYLKQGMSFIRLDKRDAGIERLKQLVAKYPKAPETARARQLLETL